MKMGIFSLLVRASLLAVSVLGQTPDVEELADRNADFATRLYSKIASSNDDNVAVSTLGATLALATLAAGAGGATRTELLEGIGVASMEKDGEPERIQTLLKQLRETTAQIQATGLFMKQDVKADDSFGNQVKQFYNADVQNVNYANGQQAKGSIDDYVRGRTGDKVKDVVENVDPQSMAMLISAAFFTGQWLQPFNVTFTQEERFYVNKYKIVQVPMMLRTGKYYLAYDPTLKVGILKLPCEEGIAMLVLLPDEDVDYTYIDESMTGEVFRRWVSKLKKTKLEIQLPRFSLKQPNSLSMSLPSLGIKEIFGSTADLSGISSDEGLKLSEVVQKVTVEVDETGGSVADASRNLFTTPLPPRLTFNRPFIFVIYHEATKCILYIGRVVDPTKN
ncbi:serpin peptidase inhibitor, clade A (alpha-1 antiproteinase, antitrypsin), member 10a [Sinocyclocheilus rhinocerous]|uniref:Protein Z-dependent protease inhibitor-like n=1 Tax=Sinocyclocheilus rhinocerous TaxID=307959 RepID=A0A673K9W1_9TELE|nr:PREDICTED: protein Z-dependent protease inhibitor-like [Sinocyclocheilus rhinocerous]XP_016372161.1 PREDICTED: protein Z-dependent protease inhibitor-like [Sinocyclocheilus rhinocerous]